MLSALDPGKQGLKHLVVPGGTLIIRSLSALDPGKQGLKHFPLLGKPTIIIIFQRLIQENKD